MYLTYIKYLFMTICSFYFLNKLLNIKTSKKIKITELIFLLVLPVASCLFKNFLDPMTFTLTSLVFILFALTVYLDNTNATLFASIISCGMSYALFTLSVFIMSPFVLIVFALDIQEIVSDSITYIVLGIIQLLFATLLFKVKRLRKGMPFLVEKGSGDLGVVISISILFITALFSLGKSERLYDFIAIIAIVVFALALFIWWRKRINKSYLDKLKSNEIESYKNQIALLTSQNKLLEQSNSNFSDIIKKDNNIIEIMESTVKKIDNEQADYLLIQLKQLKTN